MKLILYPCMLVLLSCLLVNADDSIRTYESKRAMWGWSPTKSKKGLPANHKIPSKTQRESNKKLNKTWDGFQASVRFQQNYKGIQDLFFDFCEKQSVNELYMFGTTWEWSKKSIAKNQ